MAEVFNEEVTSVKLKLKFEDNQGTYTFSKIKTNASDANIFATANAIAALKNKRSEEVYKMVTTDLYYTSE